MCPASWDQEQRGKRGVAPSCLSTALFPQGVYQGQWGEGGGERAVPGPWKLPGLTLSNLLGGLEQAPSAYFSEPWKADQIFQSRTFPC